MTYMVVIDITCIPQNNGARCWRAHVCEQLFLVVYGIVLGVHSREGLTNDVYPKFGAIESYLLKEIPIHLRVRALSQKATSFPQKQILKKAFFLFF